MIGQHGLKLLYISRNFAHFRNIMRKTWILGLIDIKVINETFEGDWTYESIWRDIIKPQFDSKIYPSINNNLKFSVKQFVKAYEKQYIDNDQIKKWNVSEMPITTTGNIESSNRAITKKLGHKPTMGRFIVNLNSYIEQTMRKFEQFIKFKSMDRRKRKVVLRLQNRNAAIDQVNNVNEYLQLMVDTQFNDSYLNKFARTVNFGNMTDSDKDNENDEEKEEQLHCYNNSNDNNSNFSVNNNINDNNSIHISQNMTTITDSASEYLPHNRQSKHNNNNTKHSASDTDSDSASDYMERPKKRRKK